jgi:hypothetical protein
VSDQFKKSAKFLRRTERSGRNSVHQSYVPSIYPFVWLALFGIFLNLALFVIPLLNIGSLYTIIQDPDFSDQNFYLYYAREFCHARDLTIQDYNVTWSSVGVMYYLTSLCSVSGTELIYSLVNPILFSGSIYFIYRELAKQFELTKIRWAILFGFPHTIYLMALPGKEILSWIGAACLIYALLLYSRPKPDVLKAIPIALVGLLVLVTNRPHELVIFGAALALLFPIRHRLVIGTAVVAVGVALLFTMAGASDIVAIMLDQLDARESVGMTDQYGGALSGLEIALSSSNEFIHAALSPARALMLFLSPFSIIFRSINFGEINYFVFREIPPIIKLIDCGTAVYIFVLYYRENVSAAVRRYQRAFILIWMLTLFAITYPGLQQKSRYLFQYFPLIMLVGLVAQGERRPHALLADHRPRS